MPCLCVYSKLCRQFPDLYLSVFNNSKVLVFPNIYPNLFVFNELLCFIIILLIFVKTSHIFSLFTKCFRFVSFPVFPIFDYLHSIILAIFLPFWLLEASTIVLFVFIRTYESICSAGCYQESFGSSMFSIAIPTTDLSPHVSSWTSLCWDYMVDGSQSHREH